MAPHAPAPRPDLASPTDDAAPPLWRMALGNHTLADTWLRHPITDPQAKRRARRNLLAWTQRQGFDGIDLGAWAFDFYRAPLSELRELQQDIADAGLTLVALNCLRKCITHPAVAAQNRRDLWRAVEVACELRVPYVSISLSLDADAVGVPQRDVRGTRTSPGSSRDARPGEFEEAAAFLRQLAAAGQPHSVEVVVELHHCSLADTSATLLRLLLLADHPNLTVNPDLGNVTWGYDEPEEAWQQSVEQLAGRVNFWHVKNLHRVHIPEVQRAAFVHAPLADGDIDYRWAISHMLSHGFRGWLSLEAAGPGDWLSFAARGKAYLDELHAEFRDENNRSIAL